MGWSMKESCELSTVAVQPNPGTAYFSTVSADEGGCMATTLTSVLHSLLSSHCLSFFSSLLHMPAMTGCLQLPMSAFMPSQSESMWHTSLNHKVGLPTGLWQVARSPYSMSLGICPASMLLTWPSNHKHHLAIRVKMLGNFAWSRTSFHVIPRILHRKRMWKELRQCSWEV